MTAVAAGFGTAIMLTVATLCLARCSRAFSPVVAAMALLTGELVLLLPVAIAGGVPADLSAPTVMWLLVSGVGITVGELLVSMSFRRTKVGVAAAIVSCEGATAAILAAIGGEALRPLLAVGLAMIAAGVALVAMRPGAEDLSGSSMERTGMLLALGAAIAFGASLFAIGRASGHVSVFLAVLPSRVLGALILLGYVLLGPRLRIPSAMAPWLACAALADASGFLLFAVGSRSSIAVTAVLASQFAALTVVFGFVFFRERLVASQLAGVAAITLGVATVALLRG